MYQKISELECFVRFDAPRNGCTYVFFVSRRLCRQLNAIELAANARLDGERWL